MSLKSTATHSAAPTPPAALLHHFTLTTAAVTTNHQQVAPTDQESHRPTSQRSAAGSSDGREQKHYKDHRADGLMLDVSFQLLICTLTSDPECLQLHGDENVCVRSDAFTTTGWI